MGIEAHLPHSITTDCCLDTAVLALALVAVEGVFSCCAGAISQRLDSSDLLALVLVIVQAHSTEQLKTLHKTHPGAVVSLRHRT